MLYLNYPYPIKLKIKFRYLNKDITLKKKQNFVLLKEIKKKSFYVVLKYHILRCKI